MVVIPRSGFCCSQHPKNMKIYIFVSITTTITTKRNNGNFIEIDYSGFTYLQNLVRDKMGVSRMPSKPRQTSKMELFAHNELEFRCLTRF